MYQMNKIIFEIISQYLFGVVVSAQLTTTPNDVWTVIVLLKEILYLPRSMSTKRRG